MKQFCLVLTIALAINIAAQEGELKPLDHDVYDFWNKIYLKEISASGDHVFWTQGPEDGDRALNIASSVGGIVYSQQRADSARFSPTGDFVAFLIRPPKDSLKQAKKDGKKGAALPKDTLGIYNTRSGSLDIIPETKSFALPKEDSHWIAYLMEAYEMSDSTASDSAAAPDSSKAAKKTEGKSDKKAKKKDKKKGKKRVDGTELVLKNMSTGDEFRYEMVKNFQFSENGEWMWYTAASKDSTADGVFLVNTASGDIDTLMHGPGEYIKAVFDEDGKQVAFLSNRDSVSTEQQAYQLYYRKTKGDDLRLVAAEHQAGIPAGWWVSKNGSVHFSEDGKRLFFGTAPRLEDEPEEDDKDDQVVVDIWHWQDARLYTNQVKEVAKEKRRSYKAVFNISKKKVVQLANQSLPDISLGDEGNADFALGWKFRSVSDSDSEISRTVIPFLLGQRFRFYSDTLDAAPELF